MSDFNTYKNRAIALCENSEKFAMSLPRELEAKTLNKVREKLNKTDIYIVVCGEMKRGKSSMLGALLNEPDLFPTDVNVATNAVTIVKYGLQESVEVFFGDETKKPIKIPRSSIRDYVTEQGNKKNNKEVRLLIITLPNDKLKDGLVFVDTPGVGSLNQSHAEVTYGYLPNADVLLFVSDLLSPLTETELAFLETAYKHCKTILFPLTKKDKSTEADVIEAANREKICAVTKMNMQDICFIPISSLNQMSNSKLIKKQSNFDTLEKTIWNTVYTRRSQILLLPSIVNAATEIASLRKVIALENQTLVNNAAQNDDLKKKLEERIAERKSVNNKAAKWRIRFNSDISVIGAQVRNSANDQISDLSVYLESQVRAVRGETPIDALLSTVNQELSKITYEAKNALADSLNELCEKTAEELNLNVSVYDEIINVDFTPDTSIDVQGLSKKSDRALAYGRNISVSAGAGGALLGLAGALVGGTIGLLVGGPAVAIAFGQAGMGIGAATGAAAGTIKGAIDGKDKMNEIDVPIVLKEFSRYIGKKQKTIVQSIELTIKNATMEMMEEITQKLSDQVASLEQSAFDLQSSLKLSVAEHEQKRVKCQNSMKTVMLLSEQATALIYELDKPADSADADMKSASKEEQNVAADPKPGTAASKIANRQNHLKKSANTDPKGIDIVVSDSDEFDFLKG